MRFVLLVYFALFILMTTSCQKSQQEALAGANSICMTQPASCNSSVYQQSNGYSAYSNSQNPFLYENNSAYLCNCPYGSLPTYNSYAGLGCVQSSFVNFNFYGNLYTGYLYLSWGQNQWSYQSQLSTYSNSYANNCYNGAVQSCMVDQDQNCAAGSVCRQNSSGSNLGLCVTSYR